MTEMDSFIVLSPTQGRVERKAAFGTRPLERTFARSVGVLLSALGALGALGYVHDLWLDGSLFGLLHVDGVYNMLHLLSGFAGIAAGFAPDRMFARRYCLICAFLYSGVALATLIGTIPAASGAILRPDNMLHLCLAAASLVAYFVAASRTRGAEPGTAG